MGKVFLYDNGGGGGGSGATLTITAPAGCTVTVAKDGKTKTRTANAAGIAEFKGLATGDWVVTIAKDGQTATKTVAIVANYSTSIAFFSATINITYPAGTVCTATDGKTQLTSPDTSGTWNLVVDNPGPWTITSTQKSETVTVFNGEMVSVNVVRVYLIKDGVDQSSITGGWGTYTYVDTNDISVSAKSGYIHIEFSTYQYTQGLYSTRKAVSLAKYKNLYIECYQNKAHISSGNPIHGTWLFVDSNQGGTGSVAKVALGASVGNRTTIKLPIESISSNLYVKVGGGPLTNLTIDVYNLWLEV